jgi:hypothetical protein
MRLLASGKSVVTLTSCGEWDDMTLDKIDLMLLTACFVMAQDVIALTYRTNTGGTYSLLIYEIISEKIQ